MGLIAFAFTHTSNYGGRRKSPPAFVILHGSGLPEGATADSEIAYLQRPSIGVSYHYYVTKDGRIFQLVSDEFVAFHAGVSDWAEGDQLWSGLNAYSLGIGLESHNAETENYPDVQVETARWLTQGLMMRYDIPLDRVLTHKEISAPRKQDPVNFPIEDFRASL